MKNRLFFLMIIVFFSCSDSNIPRYYINTIKIDGLPDNVYSFFDIVEDYQIIKLETIADGLIGQIHKLIITQDKIFILDLLSARSVFCFDRNGNFIRIIGSQGRGPGEWLQPQDIAFHEDTQTFIIYCSSNRKIIFYTINGDYIDEINLGLKFKSLEFINKDTIIGFSHGVYNIHPDYGELPFDLITFNAELNILNTQFFNNTEINIGKTVVTKYNYFSNSDKGIYLNWFSNDTIFLIEKNDLHAKPFVYLDFGKKQIKRQHLSELDDVTILKRIYEDKNRSIIRPVHVSNNLMLIEFAAGLRNDNPDDNYRILYNLKTGMKLMFKDLIYDNNNKWINPIGVTNDGFINIIYPFEFKGQKIDFLEKIESGLDDENPIIILYKFRKPENWK